MRFLDVSADPRLARVMELLAELGRLPDPRDALETLAMALPGPPRAYAEVCTAGEDDAVGFSLRRLRSHEGTDLLALPPVEPDPASLDGGMIRAVIRTPLPKIVHDLDLSADPVLPPEMRPYRSAMAVPIFAEDVARDWVLLFGLRADEFQADDLCQLVVRTHLVGTALANLRIARQLVSANIKINKEISDIAAIQQALLPAAPPRIPGLRLAVSLQTPGQAGGDFYDFVPLARRPGHDSHDKDGRWSILIGDVCGHGPAAAVVMAMLHSIVQAFPTTPRGPAEVLAHANRQLCAKGIRHAFATVFLAFYDPASRRFTYARAGHNPPLLLGAAGRAYLEEVGDLPVGVVPDAQYSEASLALRPGDLMVLYTDGITEARGDRQALFETHGIEAAVASAGREPADAVAAIRDAVARHTGDAPPADDQTLIAIRIVDEEGVA